jgi:putative PIN family toxin of toxin-antitoxin system
MLENIEEYAEFVSVQSNIQICRDPKDNFLLSLALDSEADFLITGDKDLLEIAQFKKTRIITISRFFELMQV